MAAQWTTRDGRGFKATYSRDSVERALTHHFGPEGQGWTPDRLRRGYAITTGRGVLVTYSLRETYTLVVGCAEVERRVRRDRHNG